MKRLIALTIQILGLAFLLLYAEAISKSIGDVPTVVLAAIYLIGIRSISLWITYKSPTEGKPVDNG
jgi:hypothetical protein